MKFGVLGTGQVGTTIASKLVELHHEVMMGSRSNTNEPAVKWAATNGSLATNGTFAEAVRHGEIVINATAGTASLQALATVEPTDLDDKVLIDIANPLDFSGGLPPTLAVCNTDSLGEQIQRAFPRARVVKTLNTVNADVMVTPDLVPGSHVVFVSGNDLAAKTETTKLLASFGWPAEDLIDLGDISTARGAEAYLILWLRVWSTLGTGHFNIAIQR
jgi:8-hydroxy-5-deazaflavin:NADPH oxidoreductase